MKTFLICFAVFTAIVTLLSFIDITYYYIKWTIKHYEKIDEMVEYYTRKLKDASSEDDIDYLLDQYDFWVNLQNTKKRIKWLFHI